MITVVYLLACVYCCCKIYFRFTSFKLRCYFINWYPTNGRSILQWKIEEDRGNKGWLHQIRGRLLTWEAKVVCFLKIWWRLNEALLNYLEAINIEMKPTLMRKGDLMISMVIKAETCALHVVTSLRKCACSL